VRRRSRLPGTCRSAVALATGAALQVMATMVEADVTELAGPKSKHVCSVSRICALIAARTLALVAYIRAVKTVSGATGGLDCGDAEHLVEAGGL